MDIETLLEQKEDQLQEIANKHKTIPVIVEIIAEYILRGYPFDEFTFHPRRSPENIEEIIGDVKLILEEK